MYNRFGLITRKQKEQIDKLINEKNKYYMKAERLRKQLEASRNEVNRLKKLNRALMKRNQELVNTNFKKG